MELYIDMDNECDWIEAARITGGENPNKSFVMPYLLQSKRWCDVDLAAKTATL